MSKAAASEARSEAKPSGARAPAEGRPRSEPQAGEVRAPA